MSCFLSDNAFRHFGKAKSRSVTSFSMCVDDVSKMPVYVVRCCNIALRDAIQYSLRDFLRLTRQTRLHPDSCS